LVAAPLPPATGKLSEDGQVDATVRARLIASFRWLDPGPHSSHLVSDRSGWWRDPAIIAGVGAALASLFPDEEPTVVVAPEVTGFLLGPLVAAALGVGFVEAYKGDRDRLVPDPVWWGRSGPDYRGRTLTLGVRAARVSSGDRALVVDDWAVTGAQVAALRDALARAGVQTVGAAVVVDGCEPAVGAALGVRGLLRPVDLPS
jgi:adenine phosphoribosyltransferase